MAQQARPIARLASLTPEIAAEIVRIRARGRVSPDWGARQVIVTFRTPTQRIVAVDSDYYVLEPPHTVHEFLIALMRDRLGTEWGRAELARPYSVRHPLLQWYEDNGREWTNARKATPSGTIGLDPTGSMAALHWFAYDLFTVANNRILESKLLNRLKNKDQFQGARYELFARAFSLRAGLSIELVNEDKRGPKHVEFTAARQPTAESFSVEAKSRHRSGRLGYSGEPGSEESIQLDFGSLLSQALAKPSLAKRIVFIDLNLPPDSSTQAIPDWFKRLKSIVEKKERQTLQDGSLLPACYLVLTNHPYHYRPAEKNTHTLTMVTGFNIPGYRELMLEQQLEKHPVVKDLLSSAQLAIPVSFPQS